MIGVKLFCVTKSTKSPVCYHRYFIKKAILESGVKFLKLGHSLHYFAEYVLLEQLFLRICDADCFSSLD